MKSNNGIGRTVVYVQGLVLRSRGHLVVSGAISDAPHLICVLGERVQALAFRGVPYFHAVITGGAGKVFAVLGECHAQHPRCVPR